MDDTIKREAVIATIGVMYERCDTGDITDYRDMLLESVKMLPSAEREGEWIDNGDRYFRCSLCGTKDTDTWRWCHGCRARMRPRLQGKHFDSIIIDECAMGGAEQ